MSQSDQAFIRAYGEPPASRRPTTMHGTSSATSRQLETPMSNQPQASANYSYAGSIDVSTVSLPLPSASTARGPVPGPHARFAVPPVVEMPVARAETISQHASQRPKQWMLHQPHPRPELFEASAPLNYSSPNDAEEQPYYAPPAHQLYEQHAAVAGRIAPANKP
jgi:hypothetical protein